MYLQFNLLKEKKTTLLKEFIARVGKYKVDGKTIGKSSAIFNQYISNGGTVGSAKKSELMKNRHKL